MDNNIKMNALALNIDDAIIEKLSMIYDPEIGLDIINLGLVYEVNLEENGNCEVVITFTGMGCECIESIPGEIEEVLVELPEIKTVHVKVVWSPAWKMTRISRFGRISLGVSTN